MVLAAVWCAGASAVAFAVACFLPEPLGSNAVISILFPLFLITAAVTQIDYSLRGPEAMGEFQPALVGLSVLLYWSVLTLCIFIVRRTWGVPRLRRDSAGAPA
jgi:hypothetical protein